MSTSPDSTNELTDPPSTPESSVSESQVAISENNLMKESKHTMPMCQYLNQTVVPALLVGLKELAKERPPDPLGFLSVFLLKYKKEHVDKDSISET